MIICYALIDEFFKCPRDFRDKAEGVSENLEWRFRQRSHGLTRVERGKQVAENCFFNHDVDLSGCKSLKYAREHYLGRFIVKKIAKEKFNIDDEIVADGKKPVFKNNKSLHFSISHCDNVVVVAFDDKPVGIDVEHVVERNYEKIAKRYGKRFNNLADFYRWWTAYEAQIKCAEGNTTTFEILTNYICSIRSGENTENSVINLNVYLTKQ